MTTSRRVARSLCVLGLVGAVPVGSSWAAQPKQPATSLDRKEFFRPELYISSSNLPLQAVLPRLANRAAWEAYLQQRSGGPGQAPAVFIDPRSGTATNLIDVLPL